MTTPQAAVTRDVAHILTITPNGEEDWNWTITCPYLDIDNTPTAGRSCATWQECRCAVTLSDDDRERLVEDGEPEPCPEAPGGTHEYNGRCGFIGYLTGDCWAKACWHTSDAVCEVREAHGLGVFLVDVTSDDDGQFVEFPVLATIDSVAV